MKKPGKAVFATLNLYLTSQRLDRGEREKGKGERGNPRLNSRIDKEDRNNKEEMGDSDQDDEETEE
jgi:hypothetical protein